MESLSSRVRRWFKRNSLAHTALIFVLVLLCAFELDGILRSLRAAHSAGGGSVRYQQGHIVRTADIETPSEIQPWMTFQYVNFIFKLPPSYLETALDIADPRYPNVQIARYAKTNDFPADAFLSLVKQKVTDYPPATP